MVLIFINETDIYQHQSLALAIMERLRRAGAAGATLLKGSAGFGVHGMIHTLTLIELAAQLPEVVVWIDRVDRIERILPQIQEMVSEGLIIVQPVDVRLASHRPLEHFPPNI